MSTATKEKLVNGQRLDRQYRNVQVFPGEGNRQASLDQENRIVRDVSVSSNEPYERWYGTEILLHEKKNVDLTRVEGNAAPLLYNHDRDVSIGKITNPRLKDGKLYVDMKFSQREDAINMLADLKDGILTECSIGYDVNKFEVDEDEETYTATKWTLYEVSLVTIPADFTVGVGRQEKGGTEVEILTHEKTLIPEKKVVDVIETGGKTPTTDSATENQRTTPMPPVADPAAPEIDETKIRAAEVRATANERKRVKEIQDLNEHFHKKGLGGRRIDTSKLAAEYIRDGKSVREFSDAVMVGTFEEVETVVTDEERNDDPSGIRVIGERSRPQNQNRRLSLGAEFVRSKNFKELGPQRGTRRSVSMDFDTPMLGLRGKMAMAQRAFASSDLAAVNVQIQPGVIALGMQRLTVMDLIAPGATDAAAIIYPKENTFGSVDGVAVATASGGVPGMPRAKAVGERGLKPNWEPDLTSDSAAVKKVAITTKVPDEFMADFPAMQSYIDERLPFMVDTETEFQVLYGDGLNNNLKGIFSNANVQTRAIDTTSDTTVAASLKKGLTDIQVGSFFEADGYAFHPYDWETASLLKDTQGRFLMGGPFYVPLTGGLFVELYTFWGKPCVKTTAVTYGRPVAGSWRLGAQYFMREGMRLETTNANEDDFRRNMIAVRAEHRLALATYRPVCFLEFTGFPART